MSTVVAGAGRGRDCPCLDFASRQWPSNSLPATKARLIICAAGYHVITRTLWNKQIAIRAALAERITAF